MCENKEEARIALYANHPAPPPPTPARNIKGSGWQSAQPIRIHSSLTVLQGDERVWCRCSQEVTPLRAETWLQSPLTSALTWTGGPTGTPCLFTAEVTSSALCLHPGAHLEYNDVLVPLRQTKMAAVSLLQLPFSCRT